MSASLNFVNPWMKELYFIVEFSPQIAEAQTKNDDKQVRVAFLLTLNGRAIRQVYRLLKSLYSVDNFYYIHVDSVKPYNTK